MYRKYLNSPHTREQVYICIHMPIYYDTYTNMWHTYFPRVADIMTVKETQYFSASPAFYSQKLYLHASGAPEYCKVKCIVITGLHWLLQYVYCMRKCTHTAYM